MFILLEGGQNDDETSNTCLQAPPPQEETGMIAEPQLEPVIESVYIMLYEVMEMSVPFCKIKGI